MAAQTSRVQSNADLVYSSDPQQALAMTQTQTPPLLASSRPPSALARQLHTALMEAQKQSQYASMRLVAATRIEETIVAALRQEEERRWR